MKRTEHNINRDAKTAALARRGGEAFRAVSLPEAQSPRYPCVTLLADMHVEIENHCGVLEIGDNTVRIKTALGVLRVAGKALKIRCAESSSMLIDGCIDSVCYEKAR